jgi:prevent-host-death family protein
MADTWTVQDAKAQLSELLRRARAGQPQRIGVTDTCVIVSERDWATLQAGDLGAWLVESAPRGEDLPLPPRGSRRGDPFADTTRTARGARR